MTILLCSERMAIKSVDAINIFCTVASLTLITFLYVALKESSIAKNPKIA